MPTEGMNLFSESAITVDPINYYIPNDSFLSVADYYQNVTTRISGLSDTYCLSYQPLSYEERKAEERLKIKAEFEDFTYLLELKVN